MRIGIPRSGANQPLVGATPDTVTKLMSLGYDICVERSAGEPSSFPDSLYEAAGATIVDRQTAWACDLVLALDAPGDEELALMHTGATLVARMAPARNPELLEKLQRAGVTGLAMDAVPRISRAQAVDVLSSQANVAGYRAVIEAASAFGRLFTGQVTAAGKMPPAKVYVIGAGVAGLAAIGTAQSMGAQVVATDVRPEVAEQIESMGASFIALPTQQEVSSDGYAAALSADSERLAQELYAEVAAESDIVITTANIPGREAPVLLTEEAVAAMRPGSVIVDMAAANGGNCALTCCDEVIVTDNGVTIIGHADLASRLPGQASQLYAQNVVNLLKLMTPEKDGELVVDLDDEIVRSITVTAAGEILWPPPPVKVSAAPNAAPEPSPEEIAAAEARAVAEQKRSRRRFLVGTCVAALALTALILATPAAAAGNYIVLMLAIVVGFYVITGVAPALHTPLMSLTNAISGIILVGAILQVGSDNLLVSIFSYLAIIVASINIFGGFLVTDRMLEMFKKD